MSDKSLVASVVALIKLLKVTSEDEKANTTFKIQWKLKNSRASAATSLKSHIDPKFKAAWTINQVLDMIDLFFPDAPGTGKAPTDATQKEHNFDKNKASHTSSQPPCAAVPRVLQEPCRESQERDQGLKGVCQAGPEGQGAGPSMGQ
uniref:MATH domain-containing protein n=1 Tax=Chlamydomonas euryale TaxID=1486919 RepID=A0A6U2J7X7_9CHLO|mmetsp:Transcript_5581/g.16930  ORF Transcript_5581/g.16930 Transcript_5581/m.16930 type:complete len:147 (+) Transcript_5581:371-811(+)